MNKHPQISCLVPPPKKQYLRTFLILPHTLPTSPFSFIFNALSSFSFQISFISNAIFTHPNSKYPLHSFPFHSFPFHSFPTPSPDFQCDLHIFSHSIFPHFFSVNSQRLLLISMAITPFSLIPSSLIPNALSWFLMQPFRFHSSPFDSLPTPSPHSYRNLSLFTHSLITHS